MRFRKAIVFTLIVAILAGSLMAAGCGSSSKAALQMPTIELFQYSKGATVDFDETTINSAANAEAERQVRDRQGHLSLRVGGQPGERLQSALPAAVLEGRRGHHQVRRAGLR